MILQALCEYYDRKKVSDNPLPQVGFGDLQPSCPNSCT
jgi:CRISPR-associated protein Csd1